MKTIGRFILAGLVVSAGACNNETLDSFRPILRYTRSHHCGPAESQHAGRYTASHLRAEDQSVEDLGGREQRVAPQRAASGRGSGPRGAR